jgi:hypothetical protein
MTSIMDLHIVRTSVAYVRLQERERQTERERERERETLRKLRGPWLFSNPASAPSTKNGTVADAPNCFCPDHSIA